MKVSLLPSALSGHGTPAQFLTSYLIGDDVVVDAGSIGFQGDLAQQRRVRHVLLSHTHIDHVASLPILLDNVVDVSPFPVTVYGTEVVRDCLERDLFNGRLWPDFFALSTEAKPLIQFQSIDPGRTVTLGGLRITPVNVNHVVPTVGFILEDDTSAVVIASDTSPTDEIWERANRLANLRAVFLEATFPDSLTRLADVSKHLTPASFFGEVGKLKPGIRIVAVHLKARLSGQVAAELNALGLANLEIVEPGKVYEF